MPISYKVVPKHNPSDRSLPPKFYAQAINKGMVEMRSMADKIGLISTVSTVDTVAVLEGFIQAVPAELAEGRSVRMGEFGIFSITVNSEGADTEESFTSGNIKKVIVHFRPGKLFKNVLNTAGYKKE
jgi:predicted histone-like DNA-binding protein